MVGSHAKLGEWDPAQGLNATSIDKKIWSALIQLPTSQATGPIEFKAVVKRPDSSIEWENCGNRVMDPQTAIP